MNKRLGSTPCRDDNLSTIYTNHSVRVTSIAYLTRKPFSGKCVMSVIGTSPSTVWLFVKKFLTDRKLSMASAMSCYLQSEKT